MDVNPPTSPDVPWEYVEIRGTPGLALTNIYVVDLEGDAEANRGDADHAWNLSAYHLGTNGLLVIKSSTGGFTMPPQTTVVGDPAFNTGTSALENGACTFLIIQSLTPIVKGHDYDANNDGILELPPGAIVLDSVGWTANAPGDWVYSPAVLTQSAAIPDAATRFTDNLKPSSFNAWYNGDIIDVAPWYVDYDQSEASANMPEGGKLTPGYANSHSMRKISTATPRAYLPPLPLPSPSPRVDGVATIAKVNGCDARLLISNPVERTVSAASNADVDLQTPPLSERGIANVDTLPLELANPCAVHLLNDVDVYQRRYGC
jgi:hypothetical protein